MCLCSVRPPDRHVPNLPSNLPDPELRKSGFASPGEDLPPALTYPRHSEGHSPPASMKKRKARVKGHRAKGSHPVRPGPAESAPTAGTPPTSQELGPGERDAVLRYAADLKRLGIEPDILLLDELRAEEALRQLGYQQDADVAGALRALVRHPIRSNVDALDAPSLRRELKAARTHRMLVGDRFPPKARINLDASAEALRLTQEGRGAPPKPVAEREFEAAMYGGYLLLQEMFRKATGAAEPKENAVNKFIAENRRLIELPADYVQLLKAKTSTGREMLLELALKRQIEAFKREKKNKVRDPLMPSQRCALALVEMLRGGYPAKDEDLDKALKLVRRLQRSFRLMNARTTKRAEPKKA